MIEYTLDDLQAFAAYEGRDPVTLHVAQVARTALAHGEALEAEVERLRAREKELVAALRPLHDAACRICDLIASDETLVVFGDLDEDDVLMWLAEPIDLARDALAEEGGEHE